MEWFSEATAAVIVAVIASAGTLLATRRKARVDETAAHLAGVNAATKQLMDAMFVQINALHEDIKRLRKDTEEARAELLRAKAEHQEEQARWAFSRLELEQEVQRLQRLYGAVTP